jgi:hypothetical protein
MLHAICSYLDASRAHGGVAWTAQLADAACRPDPHVAEFRGRDAIVCLRNQLASWPRVTVRLRPTLAADVLAARSSRECLSRSLSARRVSCGVAARAPPILDRLRVCRFKSSPPGCGATPRFVAIPRNFAEDLSCAAP